MGRRGVVSAKGSEVTGPLPDREYWILFPGAGPDQTAGLEGPFRTQEAAAEQLAKVRPGMNARVIDAVRPYGRDRARCPTCNKPL